MKNPPPDRAHRHRLGFTYELEDDPEQLSSEQVETRLRTTFESPDYRPPSLPTVATELLDLSARGDVAAAELSSLIEKDSLLAARVLRVAGSPVYAGSMPILSLKQAVVRLGLAGLRDVVLEAAFHLRIFRAQGYTDAMELLRNHSLAVAYLARLVCRYTTVEGEHAFACGLMHDLGAAAGLMVLGDVPRGKAAPPLDRAWPAVDALHEKTAGRILEAWGVRPEIRIVVENHHHLHVGGYPHPLVAVLQIAESLARQFGLPCPDERTDVAQLLVQRGSAMQVLNLSPPQLVLIEKEATKLIESGTFPGVTPKPLPSR